MKVVSLHVYPIKGTRAVDLDRAQLHQRGLEHDRRWLIVKPDGYFTTQRSHSQLAAIQATPSATGIRLSALGMPDLDVRVPDGSDRLAVTVWQHRVDAALADKAAHDWLTKFFGEDLRLVHMDARAVRLKESVWAPTLPVSFADGYPVLIATTGSLAAVNKEIERTGGQTVTMRRFRPNVVIDDPSPWADDFWATLKIGKVELDLVKPCDRCVVTTKDQLTGATTGDEPLTALRTLRLSGDKRVAGVLFGWNAAPKSLGEIRVGDEVQILATRPEGFPIHGAKNQRATP